jgi:hypothetical protein
MKTINGPGHIARGVSSCRSTPMRSLQNDKVCSPTAPGANSTPPRCRRHCIQQSTMDMRPRHRALAGRLGHFDCSTTLTTWINETNQRASTQLAQWNLVITTPGDPTTVHPNPPTANAPTPMRIRPGGPMLTWRLHIEIDQGCFPGSRLYQPGHLQVAVAGLPEPRHNRTAVTTISWASLEA